MTDTRLLETLFQNVWSVARENGRFRVEGCFPITEWMDDPRKALMQAIRLDQLHSKSALTLEENVHPELFRK